MDYVVGRAVWLSNHGRPEPRENRKAGRGRVDCPKCGAWVIEIVAGAVKTCGKCGTDCSDSWPEQISE